MDAGAERHPHVWVGVCPKTHVMYLLSVMRSKELDVIDLEGHFAVMQDNLDQQIHLKLTSDDAYKQGQIDAYTEIATDAEQAATDLVHSFS